MKNKTKGIVKAVLLVITIIIISVLWNQYPEQANAVWDWMKDNKIAVGGILLLIIEFILNDIPSMKSNSILLLLYKIVTYFVNNKARSGTNRGIHEIYKKKIWNNWKDKS